MWAERALGAIPGLIHNDGMRNIIKLDMQLIVNIKSVFSGNNLESSSTNPDGSESNVKWTRGCQEGDPHQNM